MIDLNKLYDPFPASQISWRVGATNQEKTKGIALAYIDARDVMKRLDFVCGPENWQSRYPWSDGKRLVCEVGIRVNGEWLWKANGAGDTDVEAEKGAMSDAFKRAAVLWGIGQYLYDLPNRWVPIENRKIAPAAITQLTMELEEFQLRYFYTRTCEKYADSIMCITDSLNEGNLSTAAEAWFELDAIVKGALWKAPSAGGCFSTEHRKIMQSKEFKDSYFGAKPQ